MPSSRPPATPPRAASLRPGEFYVSLGSTTLSAGSSASLTRTFGPDAERQPPGLSPAPSAAHAPVTYSAAPNDGTPDGDKLALMNDLMRAVPGGATTTLWFDDRAPEVQHHDTATPADDLVTLNGDPPASVPALAAVVAAAIRKED